MSQLHCIRCANSMVSVDAAREMLLANAQEDFAMPAAENTKRCRLIGSIRDHAGWLRFKEEVQVLREVVNLDRHLFLVRFADGATTFLFPNEFVISEEAA